MIDFFHLPEWFKLPVETKRRIFTETSEKIGLPSPPAAEKDWWVVHTLSVIFSLDCSKSLIFKGGTSLSKGWNLIQRFSEDIDLALDREFLGFKGELNNSEIRRLRRKSNQFITNTLTNELKSKFSELGFREVTVQCREVDNHEQDPLIIEIYYNKLTETDTYLKPGILVEVGSRSLTEPYTKRNIGTMASELFPNLPFADKPINVPVVNPERTFLEKIFLLHEEFQKPSDKIRVNRLSRHLYDIERLSRTEFAETALQNKDLYNTIVNHRSKFNAINGIDYTKHTCENINFIPPDHIILLWENDYKEMQESMLYGEQLNFDELITRLHKLQSTINRI